MATALVQAQCAHSNPHAGFPADFFTLLDELHACRSKEQLRRWALDTTPRRAALPKPAQAEMRLAVASWQGAIRLQEYPQLVVQPAAKPNVPFRVYHEQRQAERDASAAASAERDLERIALVRSRLAHALVESAGDVTEAEYDALHALISNAVRQLAQDAIECLGINAWFGAVAATEGGRLAR